MAAQREALVHCAHCLECFTEEKLTSGARFYSKDWRLGSTLLSRSSPSCAKGPWLHMPCRSLFEITDPIVAPWDFLQDDVRLEKDNHKRTCQ